MSKVIVFTNVTLNVVMQAKASPDEDLRRGFEHGGWAVPHTPSTSGAERQSGGNVTQCREQFHLLIRREIGQVEEDLPDPQSR